MKDKWETSILGRADNMFRSEIIRCDMFKEAWFLFVVLLFLLCMGSLRSSSRQLYQGV